MKNIAFACGKNVRIAPRKIRLAVDYMRGKNIKYVYGFLENDIRRANPILLNIVKSAVANAVERNDSIEPDELIITEAYVNQGKTHKRMRPRAMGRGMTIRKKMSHVFVAVGTLN